jgi:cell division protein FtsW
MAREAAARKPAGRKRPPEALLQARRRQGDKQGKPKSTRPSSGRSSARTQPVAAGKAGIRRAGKTVVQGQARRKAETPAKGARTARTRETTVKKSASATGTRRAASNPATVRRRSTNTAPAREEKRVARQRTAEPPRQVIDIASRRQAARERSLRPEVATRSGLSGTGYSILGVSLLMFLYGMVMIFSASSGAAFRVYGSSYYFLIRQGIWFGVGLIGLIAMAYFDYHRLVTVAPILVGIALAGLAAVLVIATETYGSRRGINAGPMVFQPSEFAKLSLLLFAVYIYDRRRGKLDSWREIIMPVLLIAGLACVLIILEPDLGTMLIAAISVFIVLFLAGAPLRKLAALATLGAGLTALFIFTSSYRKARFLAFLHPWDAPREGGFHIIQSMVALGSGSATGLGLGMSRQKFFYLPNAHTDFIFSIIGEEIGLIGTIAVLALFATFLFLGLRAARRAPDGLGRLLATSITFMIIVQAFINMGAATGILPITGVTLPFFSYGGSSLLICMCLAGILINVSRQEVEAGIPDDGRKKRERRDMRGRNRRTSPSTPGPRGRTSIA